MPFEVCVNNRDTIEPNISLYGRNLKTEIMSYRSNKVNVAAKDHLDIVWMKLRRYFNSSYC